MSLGGLHIWATEPKLCGSSPQELFKAKKLAIPEFEDLIQRKWLYFPFISTHVRLQSCKVWLHQNGPSSGNFVLQKEGMTSGRGKNALTGWWMHLLFPWLRDPLLTPIWINQITYIYVLQIMSPYNCMTIHILFMVYNLYYTFMSFHLYL